MYKRWTQNYIFISMYIICSYKFIFIFGSLTDKNKYEEGKKEEEKK